MEKIGQKRLHKGMPLVWMSDCFGELGMVATQRRYLMLTLVEDAIRGAGVVSPNDTGVYFRLVWNAGLPDPELRRYAQQMHNLNRSSPVHASFPEWVLQQLDNDWSTAAPTAAEAGAFTANTVYIQYLIDHLGDGSGKFLEALAEYVLSCMPGCRTTRRAQSYSTDYDIVCAMEGLEHDFRSELGRYFLCECKDWKWPADFSAFAKFCRVLDSVRCRFGILFSRNGITGHGSTTDARREQLKIFHDRGIVIVVVDESDVKSLANGASFVTLLRRKYEEVRLDLRNLGDTRPEAASRGGEAKSQPKGK